MSRIPPATGIAALLCCVWLPGFSYAQSSGVLGSDSTVDPAEQQEVQNLFLPDTLTTRGREPEPPTAEGSPSVAWLQGLRMPDFPVRLTDPVIEQLERIRGTGWWHNTMERWLRRSGRYEGMIRRIMREEGVPQDLLYVAMIESSFNPRARSRAGATGLWQFMPAAASESGLRRDNWVDQRLDPEASTRAAARMLRSYFERLGSWELALAAYNMGYYGLLTSIRLYNTNDYWRLRSYEFALPYETRNYVPRIFAAAVVGRNPDQFGITELVRDPSISFEILEVPRPIALGRLARLLGTSTERLRDLNPEIRRNRTPASKGPYRIRVPVGTRDKAAPHLRRIAGAPSELGQHEVRLGEDLGTIAREHGISRGRLAKLNEMRPRADLEPGTILTVPTKTEPNAALDEEQVKAIVPNRRFIYRERRRVFYRVVGGDTLERVAQGFGVTPAELVLWNDLDPSARLQPEMILQVFVPIEQPDEQVRTIEEGRVKLFVAGSTELYEDVARGRERRRITYRSKRGDTLKRLGRRFKLSTGLIARINHFGRQHKLSPGEEVVLYVEPRHAPKRSRKKRAVKAVERPAPARPEKVVAITTSPPTAEPAPRENNAAIADASPTSVTDAGALTVAADADAPETGGDSLVDADPSSAATEVDAALNANSSPPTRSADSSPDSR